MFVAYKITRTETGKSYIGVTAAARIRDRWQHHRNVGRRGIGAAIKKYGDSAFSFDVVASARTLEDVLSVEAVLIAQEGTLAPRGYNLNLGGKGTFGASDETRKLIGAANSRREWSNESRQKARARLVGKARSEESRAKQAATMKGRPVSPEARAKIAAKAKERMNKPEWKARNSAWLSARKLSPESRQKIADSLRRRHENAAGQGALL